MAGTSVLVGSKLPVALILHHPLDASITVTVRGLNSAAKGTNGQPIAVPFVTTEVEADFWEAWKGAHKKSFKPLTSGAIFDAKTPDAIKAIAREREKVRTGLEPGNPEAYGVKKADHV